jgi:hypothetical protein
MATIAYSDRVEDQILNGLEGLDEFLEKGLWLTLSVPYASFIEWWDKKVPSHNIREVLQIRSEYRKMIINEMKKPQPKTGRTLSNREVARKIGVSPRTVDNDVEKINTAQNCAQLTMEDSEPDDLKSQDLGGSCGTKKDNGPAVPILDPDKPPTKIHGFPSFKPGVKLDQREASITFGCDSNINSLLTTAERSIKSLNKLNPSEFNVTTKRRITTMRNILEGLLPK